MDRPLSVLNGRRSSEAIKLILDTHFPDAKTAIDSTWGKGVFWKGIDGIDVIGTDIEQGRCKDLVADCRMLPFDDKSFDVGVLDLPFMHAKTENGGTNLWDDFRGIGNQKQFVSVALAGMGELERVCRDGFVVKCKDSIEAGKYKPVMANLINNFYKPVYDVLIFVPQVTLANDPKWKTVQHFRRQESYFLIYKTGGKKRN